MTPAAATDGRAGTSPRCGAAGRAGAGPAAAHPAPALCGWVAPPPPRPAPPLRRVSPAGGDGGAAPASSGDLPRLSRRARPVAAALCAGLPRESGAAVRTPGPARVALAAGARRRSPALPGAVAAGARTRGRR